MELAKIREMEREAPGNEESSGSDDEDDPQTPEDEMPDPQERAQSFLHLLPVEEDSEDARDPRTRVLSVLELEDLFSRVAPDLTSMAYSLSVDKANVLFPLQPSRMLLVTIPLNSWLAWSATPTLGNPVPSTLSSAKRKSAFLLHREKQSISKRSTSHLT